MKAGMYCVCVEKEGVNYLTIGKIYKILAMRNNAIEVENDMKNKNLYHASRFNPVGFDVYLKIITNVVP